MHIARLAVALALITPLAACYQYGELGKLGFELGVADALYEFESGERVLVGTHLCPRLAFANFGIDEGHLVDPSNEHCFSETLAGPAQFDAEHCWMLDSPGEVIWEITATREDGCEPQYSGDRMVLEVVAPSDDLQLGFDDWRVRMPTAPQSVLADDEPQTVIGLSPGRTLDDLREDPGAARRVFAGQLDTPMLRLDDDLGRIYFADADVTFELVGEGATPVEPTEPIEPGEYSTESRYPGERPLVLDPDAVARVRATLPGGVVLESPELIAVAPSDAASLDLLVMLADDGVPVAAYAEVRDGQDRVLHAAPIEWGVVEGAIAVFSGHLGNEARTDEYAILSADCEPPSESEPIERHAVLRARLGALEDTVELTWIEPPVEPDDNDLPFEPNPNCMFGDDPGVDDGGCACSTDAESRNGGPTWLALAALLFVRRRRS
jgi:MYXO-CTERM domain-containing protein